MKMGVFVVLAALVGMSAAAQADVRGADIVEFGIYSADLQSATRDSSGVLQNQSTNFRRALATTTVPAQSGLRFGVMFTVTGEPHGQDVTVRTVTVYPPQGLRPPGAAQPLYRSESMSKVRIGEPQYTGYRFDDPWERVPGSWAIEIWLGNRKLAEQKFTVVAP